MEAGEPSAPLTHINALEDILHKVISQVDDCRSQVNCMAVCRKWQEVAQTVESTTVVLQPSPSVAAAAAKAAAAASAATAPLRYGLNGSVPVAAAYGDELKVVQDRLRPLLALKRVRVRIGDSADKAAGNPWAKSVRYVEVGVDVADKFLFLSAKGADKELFGSGLFDYGVVEGVEAQKGPRHSSSLGPRGVPDGGAEGQGSSDTRQSGEITGCNGREQEEQQQEQQDEEKESGGKGKKNAVGASLRSRWNVRDVDLSLTPVDAPEDESKRLLMSKIFFAILRSFDNVRHAIPDFISHVPHLESLLLIDGHANVTIHVRPHHIREFRQQQQREEEEKRMRITVSGEFGSAKPHAPFIMPPRVWSPDNFRVSVSKTGCVTAGELSMHSVCVCTVTCDESVPLEEGEVEELSRVAVAGPILSSIVKFLNMKEKTSDMDHHHKVF